MHPYPKPGILPQESHLQGKASLRLQMAELDAVARPDGPTKVLGSLYTEFSQIEQELQSFPANLNVWFTEYNLHDRIGSIHGTWLHGIFAASMTLTLLEEKRTEWVCYYDMIGGGGAGFEAIFPNNHAFQGVINGDGIQTTPYALTATGLSMQLLSQSTHGMTSAQKISFNPNPSLSAGN